MTAEHNHEPRCCCDDEQKQGGTGPCDACPEHSQLIQGVECPKCHQAAGRPHTDYCQIENPWLGHRDLCPTQWGQPCDCEPCS